MHSAREGLETDVIIWNGYGIVIMLSSCYGSLLLQKDVGDDFSFELLKLFKQKLKQKLRNMSWK